MLSFPLLEMLVYWPDYLGLLDPRILDIRFVLFRELS